MKKVSKAKAKPKRQTKAKPSQNKQPKTSSPTSKGPTEVKLGGGRSLKVNMYDQDGNPVPQIAVNDVPATSVDLIAVKMEELGYKLAGSQQSQKFNLGFERV